MTQLYQDLGIPKESSLEEIKKAFKKKAAETHPDKGGDSESFQVVQHAYSVLKDPTRRARYDASGEDQLVDEGAIIRQTLAQMFLAVVEAADDPAYIDVTGKVKQRIKAGQEQAELQIKILKARTGKLEKAAKRLKRKKRKDADFLQQVITSQIETLANSVKQAEKQGDIGKRMLEMLEDYTYTCEKRRASGPFAGLTSQFAPGGWSRI